MKTEPQQDGISHSIFAVGDSSWYTNVAIPLAESLEDVIPRHIGDMGMAAMPWYQQGVYTPAGSEFLGHAGGTGGSSTFVGFDRPRRRGVIVLTNQRKIHASSVGWRIMQGAPLIGVDAATLQPLKEYVATGFSFEVDQPTGRARINKIFPDSPAARAGLSPGLIIDRINGIPVAGKSVADLMELMRGPVGTRVQLVVVASDGSRTNAVELSKSKFLL